MIINFAHSHALYKNQTRWNGLAFGIDKLVNVQHRWYDENNKKIAWMPIDNSVSSIVCSDDSPYSTQLMFTYWWWTWRVIRYKWRNYIWWTILLRFRRYTWRVRMQDAIRFINSHIPQSLIQDNIRVVKKNIYLHMRMLWKK